MTPAATESMETSWATWVSLPKDSLANESQETIAKKLFSLYLAHFSSETVDEQARLKDYKVNNATLSAPFQYCVKDLGIDSIVDIDFSVQTVDYPNPEWTAGNGSTAEDNWINHKVYTLAVFKEGDNYTFRVMGAPPCAGIAIDGSKVP
jgi:hypothetical protein